MAEKVGPLPPEVRRQYDVLFDAATTPLSLPRPETVDPDTVMAAGKQLIRNDPGLRKAPLGTTQEWQRETAWVGGPLLTELDPKKPL